MMRNLQSYPTTVLNDRMWHFRGSKYTLTPVTYCRDFRGSRSQTPGFNWWWYLSVPEVSAVEWDNAKDYRNLVYIIFDNAMSTAVLCVYKPVVLQWDLLAVLNEWLIVELLCEGEHCSKLSQYGLQSSERHQGQLMLQLRYSPNLRR